MSYSVTCFKGYGNVTFKQDSRCPISDAKCCDISICKMESDEEGRARREKKKKKKKKKK